MSAPDHEIAAVRGGVALADLLRWTALVLPGGAALARLSKVCAGELHVRLGQMQQTLLLHEDARPFADLYVCRGEDEVLLLAEGPTGAGLRAWLAAHGVDEARDLGEDHRLLCLTGPYAWEVLGKVVGEEVFALPHHNFFTFTSWRCFRAGKTGEYSYLLLVPAAEHAALRERLLATAAALGAPGLVPVGLATLEQCALEGGHFNIFREGAVADVTPLELQLQWRVSYGRDYPGAAALLARRAAGARWRLSAVAGAAPLAGGDELWLADAPVGVIANAGWSQTQGLWVGLALLARAVALPGVPLRTTAGAEMLTRSAPLLCPRSLFIVPGKHRYRDRDRDASSAQR